MQFHVGRNGQTLGPYSVEQIRKQLADGTLSRQDLAWNEGMADWKPIADCPEFAEVRSVWSPPVAALGNEVESGAAVEGRDYAGFWKRFAARFIDGIILALVTMPLGFVIGLLGARSESASSLAGLQGVIQLMSVLIGLAYFALQESSEQQATLGKRALGIVVTDLNGQRISFGHAVGRHFAAVVNYLTLYIGWMMAGWTERKQGLHDMLAGTLVLDREPSWRASSASARTSSPASPAAGGYRAGAGASSAGKGMSTGAIVAIVAVVLVVPVGGILAAIAIPAYNDYAIRAKVSEGLSVAGAAKVGVAEYFLSNGALPESLEQAGVAVGSSRVVQSVELTRGLLVITYKPWSAGREAERLALQPYRGGDGMLVWRCGTSSAPNTAEALSTDDSAERTTLKRNLLPASCRGP